MAFEKEYKKSRGPARGGKPTSKTGGKGGKPAGTGKKNFGDKKPARGASDDRPRRSFDDKPKRDFGDRPRKRFDDAPRSRTRDDDRSRRSFDDKPKRDFGDRPRRSFDDKPKRSFGDKPARSYDDRPRKRFDDAPRSRTRDDAPRSRARDDDRPRRSFDDKPKRDFGDRPRRSFDDRPKRDFDDRPKRSFGDRPARKKFDDGFAPKKREGFEKRPAFGDKTDKPRGDKQEPIKGHELLLYGVHAVHAALRNTARKITHIWTTESGEERLKEAWDAKRHPQPEIIERRDLDRRLSEGAVHQGMAIAVEPLQDVFLTDVLSSALAPNAERHVVVLLDEVTDPHNVGAVLRSMSAFGAKALIVHKRNAPGITGVMAKIATGAVEHVPMIAVTNLAQAMEELKNTGFFVLGLDENADYPIQNAPAEGHIALVLGAEGEGLRAKTRTTCDAIASIETFGDIKSLNVSNAAAIALFSLTQKQG